jgi:NTE family protein
VTTLTQMQVVRMLNVSRGSGGAFRADKVFSRVDELLDGVTIESLPIPYTAVATDLFARKPVWFQRGPLGLAIRASIAIPGVFSPVVLGGRVLVDGGLMDPMPVTPIAAVPCDLTVVVSLTGERAPHAAPAEDGLMEAWAARIRRGTSTLLENELLRSVVGRLGAEAEPRSGGEPPEVPHGEPLPPGLRGFDVMTLSLEAMQAVISRYQLASYPPDVHVTISKDACRSIDFHRAAEMIELGRVTTEAALDEAGLLTAG